MYHKQNVNHTLNQDIKKMSSENTTSCQSCMFHFFFHIYISENFMAYERFLTRILGRHKCNLFSHNLQKHFLIRSIQTGPAAHSATNPTSRRSSVLRLAAET